MKLIVGLGNVGADYARTRHNAGFMIVDRLQAADGYNSWKTEAKFKAEIAEKGTGNSRVILAKPHTMMNLSGQAVEELCRYYKIEPEDVWLAFDEVDQPFGRLRVRRDGATTHNGVRSVIDAIGAMFLRFRFGIANEHYPKTPTDRFVLSAFTKEEQAVLPQAVSRSADIITSLLQNGEISDTTYDLLD